MTESRTDQQEPEDDSVCFYCGWPDCRCDDDDEDGYNVCEHGVGFDEPCEECDALEHDHFVTGRVGLAR